MTTDCRPDFPSDMSVTELGFKRRRPVAWLSPKELAQTGLRVVVSGMFGAYADKRELQGVLSTSAVADCSHEDELWIDYVSDLGDGFDATYTIARLLAEPKLDIGADNQRASILLMGGDQVYPSATVAEYQHRFSGPYRAALPHTDPPHPRLYALPGNHDWYDGLSAFLKVFCQGQWIGGWQTGQTRSYWALKLPARWWLWGIDIQFDTFIDKPQLDFFRGVDLQAGDSVILCSAKPSWVNANEDAPEAYATLDYFERTIIGKRHAAVRLSLTGDTHHYARYAEVGGCGQKITAGGGGAYLSATHHLPPTLQLPPPESRDPGKTTRSRRYSLEHRYPDERRSRGFRLRAHTLLRRNPGFLVLGGAVHLLYAFLLPSVRDVSARDVLRSMAETRSALVLSLLLLGGLVGFTKAKATPRLRLLGVAHAVLHLALVTGTIALGSWAAGSRTGFGFLALFAPVVFAAGAVGTGVVMAAYLAFADIFRTNSNELFAAQGIEGFKCFLRLHLTRDGVLTVYPIGVERVGRKWRLRHDDGSADPWLVPGQEPSQARLIEPPIRIDPKEGP